MKYLIVLLLLSTLVSCRTTKSNKEKEQYTYDSTYSSNRTWEKVSDQQKVTIEEKDIQATGKVRIEFKYDSGRVVEEIDVSKLSGSSNAVKAIVGALINNRLQGVTIDADGSIVDKGNIKINEQEKSNNTGQNNSNTDIKATGKKETVNKETKGVPIAVSITWGFWIIIAIVAIVLVRIYVPNLFNKKSQS